MNDFTREPPDLQDAMAKACERVIRSGRYILGQELEAFEQQWSEICGARYGIGVANGMDAIEIALRCLNIGPGDEVITTSVTAFASVLSIIRAGATPVIADIDPASGLMSIESVSRCLSRRTRAIILVHLYGQIRVMDSWVNFCREWNIHLIEDCAQSHLAEWRGKRAGSFGIAAAFSFYPTKNLGALGDAGMIVTSDATIASNAKKLRNYGQTSRYYHDVCGLNSRLDEIQAAILRVRLPYLTRWTEARQAAARYYTRFLSNALLHVLEPPEEAENHVYHLFVVLSEYREKVRKLLESSGVQTEIHYPVVSHHQRAIELSGLYRKDPLGLDCSVAFARECFSLPCNPWLTEADLESVVGLCNRLPD
jgi:dTDP-4-amino-4,6-dideoxygalactose transaminase